MPNTCAYKARTADANGVIHYPDNEHAVWNRLITRQLSLLPERACSEYLDGLTQLALPQDRIPQLDELNRALARSSGWRVARVPALISFDRFFALLASKQFPVATFIRTQEDIDYIQEPDIFHEIFGHCPMLTDPHFAEFTQTYGRLGVKATPQERAYLARLYWLTVEFGLVDTPRGVRIYGGGILSSFAETSYALSGSSQASEASTAKATDGVGRPVHQPFQLLDALRTPYRIDILQPIYYVIDRMETLYHLTRIDLMAEVHKAQQAGLFKPRFPAADAKH